MSTLCLQILRRLQQFMDINELLCIKQMLTADCFVCYWCISLLTVTGTPMIPVHMGIMTSAPAVMLSSMPIVSKPAMVKKDISALRHKENDENSGPTTTVFVGNISEKASDMLIRQLLAVRDKDFTKALYCRGANNTDHHHLQQCCIISKSCHLMWKWG